jgi:hypothetical protein
MATIQEQEAIRHWQEANREQIASQCAQYKQNQAQRAQEFISKLALAPVQQPA